jgi:hypothetical protein
MLWQKLPKILAVFVSKADWALVTSLNYSQRSCSFKGLTAFYEWFWVIEILPVIEINPVL